MSFLNKGKVCTLEERFKDGKQGSCEEDERNDLDERPIARTTIVYLKCM
jgi:hypothetical protein